MAGCARHGCPAYRHGRRIVHQGRPDIADGTGYDGGEQHWPRTLTVTHIFLLWAKDLISLADLVAPEGRARDPTCSMKRVVGPRPSSGRPTLAMPDAPTVS